jgi:hypothetical protein
MSQHDGTDPVPEEQPASTADSPGAAEPTPPRPPAASRWSQDNYPRFDPWSAMSSIMAGVLLWGFIGWGLTKWTGIEVLAGMGILLGGVLGTLVVYLRYGRPQPGPPRERGHGGTPAERGQRPTAAPPSPVQEEKP